MADTAASQDDHYSHHRRHEQAAGDRQQSAHVLDAERAKARREEQPARAQHGGKHEESSVEQLIADLAAHERRSQLGGGQYHAILAREAARARLQGLESASERAMFADVAFQRSLASVYREPEAAREAFLQTAKQQGAVEAVRRLGEEPERYGKLAIETRATLFGLIERQDATKARAGATEAAMRGRNALDAEHTLHEVTQRIRTQRIESERADNLRTVQQFGRELGMFYCDPSRAHAEFDQIAHDRGAEYAADSIRRHPLLAAGEDFAESAA
jgi:hypothetical protein